MPNCTGEEGITFNITCVNRSIQCLVCLSFYTLCSTLQTPQQLFPEPSSIGLPPALSSTDPPCDLCLALVNYVIDLGGKDNVSDLGGKDDGGDLFACMPMWVAMVMDVLLCFQATIEKLAYGFCSSLNDPVLALGVSTSSLWR